VLALKDWLSRQEQPPLSVVGCAEHKALALEIASRAVTLVRDEAGLLPLSAMNGARLAVVVPRPADLTPADTSSYVMPGLAQALRHYHPAVDEFLVPLNPSDEDVRALGETLKGYARVVVGTINAGAYPGQARLVNALLEAGTPTVAAALRMPYDLQVYPAAPTYLCSYSILEPSMEALAAALWGELRPEGRLPVSIPGVC
jgi:beta-N-acetylhexosaminidase